MLQLVPRLDRGRRAGARAGPPAEAVRTRPGADELRRGRCRAHGTRDPARTLLRLLLGPELRRPGGLRRGGDVRHLRELAVHARLHGGASLRRVARAPVADRQQDVRQSRRCRGRDRVLGVARDLPDVVDGRGRFPVARARLRSDRSPDGAADRRRRGRDDRLDRARARRRRGMVGHTRDRLLSRPRRRLPLGSYRPAAGEGTARLAGLECRGGDRRLAAVVVAQPPPALQLLQQPSPARTAGPGRRLLVAPRYLRPLCRAARSRSPCPHDRRVDRPDDDHAPPRQRRDRGSRRLARVRGGARTWVVAVVVCRGVPVSLCGSAVLVVLAGRPLRRLPGAGGRAGAGLVRLPGRSAG